MFKRLLISRLSQPFTGTTIRARMMRGTSGTFALRIGNIALKFLTSLVLARLLGSDHFGVYNFALAWLLLLITPTLFGMDRLLVRDVAVYRKEQNWAALRGLLDFAPRLTLAFSVIVMVIALAVAWLTYDLTGRPALLKTDQAVFAEAALYTLLITMLLLPVWTLLLQQQSTMQGLQHIIVSQFPEQILQPVLFLLTIGAVYLIAGRLESAQWAMIVRSVTSVMALVVSYILLRRVIPDKLKRVTPAISGRLWIASAMPFAVNRGLVNLDQQIDVLMLGALDSAEAVAFYSVAQRGVQLTGLLLISVNVVLAPQIVNLLADGRRDQLQRLITQSARFVLAGSLPMALALIIWGKQYLSLFGKAYATAHTALILLSIGYVINIATGSVGLLLLMTRHERAALVGVVVGVTAHIVLNALLIPPYGLEGAALAASVGMVTTNLVQMGLAWRLLRLHTTALGAVRLWIR